MEKNTTSRPKHLAWHETLELHELVIFQSIGLMKVKTFISEVQDKELRTIYEHTIKSLEKNLDELLKFYSLTPRDDEPEDRSRLDAGFFSGDLLSVSKAAVKNYAGAITETATPELREVFVRQMQGVIDIHTMVFDYMYKKGFYPAYDLEKLLKGDVKNAKKALKMNF